MLEDGLPDFYSKRVLPDSQLSDLHHTQSLRRKKRRSVLSIFSGFRKNRNSTISNQDSDGVCENVYSMIQHPRDMGLAEGAVPGENGAMPSPRPIHGIPTHGIRAGSPPCLIQRQPTDLVSMVYSCIGAEIEDSDGSSTCDTRPSDPDLDRTPSTVSDLPVDSRTNGHTGSSHQQTDRQMEPARQERIVPLTDVHADTDDDGLSGMTSVPRTEPPLQCTKPSLSMMRQRHLQESLEEAGRLEIEEEQSERKQRDFGPEGQHPINPNQTSLDQSRDKSSSEISNTSSKSSPVSPCKDSISDQRILPHLQEERAASRSPPAPERVSPAAIQGYESPQHSDAL